MFDRATLERLSQWEAIEPVPVTAMEALLAELPSALGSPIRTIWIDRSAARLSNYDSFFVHSGNSKVGEISGFMIYASSVVPVVAVGHSSVHISATSFGHSMCEPTALIEPEEITEPLLNMLFEKLAQANYQILRRVDALSPLPDGIAPYEYCLVAPPWDRLYHLLFSNTD